VERRDQSAMQTRESQSPLRQSLCRNGRRAPPTLLRRVFKHTSTRLVSNSYHFLSQGRLRIIRQDFTNIGLHSGHGLSRPVTIRFLGPGLSRSGEIPHRHARAAESGLRCRHANRSRHYGRACVAMADLTLNFLILWKTPAISGVRSLLLC
jgi:hypothetical protein